MSETIEVSVDAYEELLDDQKFLRCLNAAGVSNWDGYELAQEMMDE